MKVEYAFLCERVERVSDDTINAMGISIRRYAQPPQVPILFGDLWLVANLQADHKEVGTHEFGVLVEDERGNRANQQESLEFEVSASTGREPTYVNVFFELKGELRMLGRYTVRILVDGRERHRTHFTLLQGQQRTGSDS